MKILSSKKNVFSKSSREIVVCTETTTAMAADVLGVKNVSFPLAKTCAWRLKKKSSQKDENYESYALICNRDQKIMNYNFSHFFKNFQRPKVEAKGQMTMQWPWPLDQQPPWTI